MENTAKKDKRIIHAFYNNQTIRVYQAYNNQIAQEAQNLGKFGRSFKMDRMTWIKPSFLWMMYRSGWGTKENQERILAIDILREGFDKILEDVVLSTYRQDIYSSHEVWKEKLKKSNVRCQWDPDRDIWGNPIARRAIQLGLKGDILHKYVNVWSVSITDITEDVVRWRGEIRSRKFDNNVLPLEVEYPISENLKMILGG